MQERMYRLKAGCGKHRVGSRVLKPGDQIPERLVGGAMDKFEPVGPPIAERQPEVGLKVTPIEGTKPARFDVINQATGDPINDEPLTKTKAYKLIKTAA